MAAETTRAANFSPASERKKSPDTCAVSLMSRNGVSRYVAVLTDFHLSEGSIPLDRHQICKKMPNIRSRTTSRFTFVPAQSVWRVSRAFPRCADEAGSSSSTKKTGRAEEGRHDRLVEQ